MRYVLFIIATLSFFVSTTSAQNDQFARNSQNNGNQVSAGTDTLSQKLVLEYGLANLLDGIAVVSGSDSIILKPTTKGKAHVVDGKIIFQEFSDVVILPNTRGVIVPGSIQKSGNKVVRFKVSFWKPDNEGPRDDLFLVFAQSTNINGDFIFEPDKGEKIKLGLYEYDVVRTTDSPLTLFVEEKKAEPKTATGRDPVKTNNPKPKQK